MRLRTQWLPVAAAALTTLASADAAAAEAPADTSFLAQYSETWGFRLGFPASVTVAPDGDAVLFLRSGPRSFVQDLYSFDVASGTETKLLSAETLLAGAAESLTPEERAHRERLRMAARGIASFQISKDGRRLLVPLSGRLFVVERASGAVVELESDAPAAEDPQLSPDGAKVACVRDGDVYVTDIASGRERRLTHRENDDVAYGLAEFVAQEEMDRFHGFWWSPDSKTLLVERSDTRGVERMYISDPLHPEQAPQSWPYPRPGHENAKVTLSFVAVEGGAAAAGSAGAAGGGSSAGGSRRAAGAGGRTDKRSDARAPAGGAGKSSHAGAAVDVKWDRVLYPYVAFVGWSEHAPPTLLVQNREQTEEVLLEVDTADGATHPLLVEKDSTWLNLQDGAPLWLADGSAFLWITERAGVPQLEWRSRSGTLARTLTPPSLEVRALLHVDPKGDAAWITASEEPTETHLYRVPLDPAGGALQRVSQAPGIYGGAFAERSATYVFTSDPWEGARSLEVRRGDGSAAGALTSVAETPSFVPRAEIVRVGARDYRTVVVRPQGFDASRKYPVIVDVYGGPHGQVAVASRRRLAMDQWLADQGYVVVLIDGRGTPGRGREWERAIRGDLIGPALADQVEALLALGARFPELDLTHAGIWGWSFGGYFAAMAVMQRPAVFQCGVACAPVADWLDYDTYYTERYLGVPPSAAAAYERSSVLTYVDGLSRSLLVIHGTTDDNVYFVHSLKLLDALTRAGKSVEFMPLVGQTHMASDPVVARRLHARILEFFDRELKPRGER
ncbi:MAG: DPP IV N-terminal domain-containing protein [bacterium]